MVCVFVTSTREPMCVACQQGKAGRDRFAAYFNSLPTAGRPRADRQKQLESEWNLYVKQIHYGFAETDDAMVNQYLSYSSCMYPAEVCNYLLKFYCLDIGQNHVFDPNQHWSCALCSKFVGNCYTVLATLRYQVGFVLAQLFSR